MYKVLWRHCLWASPHLSLLSSIVMIPDGTTWRLRCEGSKWASLRQYVSGMSTSSVSSQCQRVTLGVTEALGLGVWVAAVRVNEPIPVMNSWTETHCPSVLFLSTSLMGVLSSPEWDRTCQNVGQTTEMGIFISGKHEYWVWLYNKINPTNSGICWCGQSFSHSGFGMWFKKQTNNHWLK